MKAADLSVLISLEGTAEQESPLRKSFQMSSQLLHDAEKAYQWKTAILSSLDPAVFVEKLRELLP
ncbi:hypothetical protein D3C87_1625440 [compost metagenome]